MSRKTIQAVEFLYGILWDGQKFSMDVWAQAQAAGIAEQTYYRAKRLLGLRARIGDWRRVLSLSDDVRARRDEIVQQLKEGDLKACSGKR